MGWVLVAVAAWVVAAALVAVLIGRMIARRDRQVPLREPVSGSSGSGSTHRSVPRR